MKVKILMLILMLVISFGIFLVALIIFIRRFLLLF